jgi:hypothetical protein
VRAVTAAQLTRADYQADRQDYTEQDGEGLTCSTQTWVALKLPRNHQRLSYRNKVAPSPIDGISPTGILRHITHKQAKIEMLFFYEWA